MDDNVFGLSQKALHLCEERSVLLTNNVVNSATPHYKARDIDFRKLLQDKNSLDGSNSGLLMTQSAHLPGTSSLSSPATLYRVPMQQSMDGNTVDEEIERKDFIENALHYQVNLTFVQNKEQELMKAIKGE